MTRQILVTGVNSPLGAAVSRSLRRRGHKVIGTFRRDRNAHSEVQVDEIVQIDLSDVSSYERLPLGLEAVIHVAAQSEGDTAELFMSNVVATSNLLEFAQLRGITRLVHVSAISVYGISAEGTVSEHTPIRRQSCYGAAKWATECLLAERHSRVCATSVRSPAIVGTVSHRHLLSRLASKMKSGSPSISLQNPGFLFNNLVHEDDLADFLTALLEIEPKSYRAVPVASSQPMAFGEVINTLVSKFSYRGQIEWGTSVTAPFNIDIEGALELGFSPTAMRGTLSKWLRSL